MKMDNTSAQPMASPPGHEAYSRLREDIVAGRFADGHPLVEKSLAELYGVSRTPIREALHRLEHDGLVERGDRGLQVRRHTVEEISDLYEVRSILESSAAGLASKRRSPVDVMRLEERLLRMHQYDGDDRKERVLLNRAFHLAIWKASKNELLVDTLSRLYLNVVRYEHSTLMEPGRWENALSQHADILEAIVEGSQEKAEQAMIEHLEVGRTIRLMLNRHS